MRIDSVVVISSGLILGTSLVATVTTMRTQYLLGSRASRDGHASRRPCLPARVLMTSISRRP